MNLETEKILEMKEQLYYNKFFKCENKIKSLKEIKKFIEKEKEKVLYIIGDYEKNQILMNVINQRGDILFSDFIEENGVKNIKNENRLRDIFKRANTVIYFDGEYNDGGAFFCNRNCSLLYQNDTDKKTVEKENFHNMKYSINIAREFMVLKDTFDEELEVYLVPSLFDLLDNYNCTEIIESDCDILFGLKHCIDSGMIDELIELFETQRNKIKVLYTETTNKLERIRLNS